MDFIKDTIKHKRLVISLIIRYPNVLHLHESVRQGSMFLAQAFTLNSTTSNLVPATKKPIDEISSVSGPIAIDVEDGDDNESAPTDELVLYTCNNVLSYMSLNCPSTLITVSLKPAALVQDHLPLLWLQQKVLQNISLRRKEKYAMARHLQMMFRYCGCNKKCCRTSA